MPGCLQSNQIVDYFTKKTIVLLVCDMTLSKSHGFVSCKQLYICYINWLINLIFALSYSYFSQHLVKMSSRPLLYTDCEYTLVNANDMFLNMLAIYIRYALKLLLLCFSYCKKSSVHVVYVVNYVPS